MNTPLEEGIFTPSHPLYDENGLPYYYIVVLRMATECHATNPGSRTIDVLFILTQWVDSKDVLTTDDWDARMLVSMVMLLRVKKGENV